MSKSTKALPQRPPATFIDVAAVGLVVVMMLSDEWDHLWWVLLILIGWDGLIGSLFILSERVADGREAKRRRQRDVNAGRLPS